jgi:hypothetical protein
MIEPILNDILTYFFVSILPLLPICVGAYWLFWSVACSYKYSDTIVSKKYQIVVALSVVYAVLSIEWVFSSTGESVGFFRDSCWSIFESLVFLEFGTWMRRRYRTPYTNLTEMDEADLHRFSRKFGFANTVQKENAKLVIILIWFFLMSGITYGIWLLQP